MSLSDQEVSVTRWYSKPGNAPPCSESIMIRDDSLHNALALPTIGWVESGLYQGGPHYPDSLMITLTSATVYKLSSLGQAFIDALIDRHWLDPTKRDNATLVLHESLGNALIHGNWGIEKHASSPQSFRAQAALIDSRITDARYKNIPLTLSARMRETTLEVLVQDCGKGFTADQADTITDQDHPPVTAKSGRGLQLIKNLTDDLRYEDQGRRVVMVFRLMPE